MPTNTNAQRELGEITKNNKADYSTNGLDSLLNQLSKVKKIGQDRYVACCPSHNDKSPSLAIRNDNGKILLRCFAGCTTYEIVSAIGLNLSDLFPPSDNPKYENRSRNGFSAWQLLHALKTDLVRLLIIANDLKKIDALSSDDRKFISEIVLRLNDSMAYMEGAR